MVPIREMVLEIIKLSLRKTNTADGVDQYKEAVMRYLDNQGFGEDGQPSMNVKTQEILATTVFARRNEI